LFFLVVARGGGEGCCRFSGVPEVEEMGCVYFVGGAPVLVLSLVRIRGDVIAVDGRC